MSAISPLQYPDIAPLMDNSVRPFWSVMIPAYKRTTYLERTLHSVLEQAPDADEMQIEVVDNASPTDEIEQLVQRVGKGRVNYFRHETNLGMAGNWNSCIERARGQWVHILHDDDMVQPKFYAEYRKFIEANPQCGLVFSRSIIIDEDDGWHWLLGPLPSATRSGVMDDAHFRLVSQNSGDYLRCPAVVVARRAYEKVGGFDSKAIFSTDWLMWIRVAAHFDVGYLHHPYALYRGHGSSTTGALMAKQDLIADINRTLTLGIELLPAARRESARRGANRACAQNALSHRQLLHDAGLHSVAARYAWRMWSFEPSRLHGYLLLRSMLSATKATLRRRNGYQRNRDQRFQLP